MAVRFPVRHQHPSPRRPDPTLYGDPSVGSATMTYRAYPRSAFVSRSSGASAAVMDGDGDGDGEEDDGDSDGDGDDEDDGDDDDRSAGDIGRGCEERDGWGFLAGILVANSGYPRQRMWIVSKQRP